MSSIEAEVAHLQISLQELSDATNAFSEQNLIAKGGFGKVYKGVSVKHGNIAVKILDPGLGQGDHEFKTEIALLSVYKHENIVLLLGFCDEDGQKILVYKYESNGSLDKHLSNTDLTWIQRLQICLDAARGLQYLHDDVGDQHRILHRDIKSANILLDENFRAKVSDFGLSKIGPANMQSTFLISNACGTFGYIDPDYLYTGYLTQKSDVYSFGVVLFEVLCGRLTRDTKYKDISQFLTVLIHIHYKRQTLHKIIHPNLLTQINRASFLTFSSIAYQCLMSGNERPTMKKVVEQVRKALDNQLAPSGSGSDDNDFAAHLQPRLEAKHRGIFSNINIDSSWLSLATTNPDLSTIPSSPASGFQNSPSGGYMEESSELLQPNHNQVFVKVYKSGCFEKSVDIGRINSYHELRVELGQMFGITGLLEDPLRSGWQLVFIDRENDILLLGDDPWEPFVKNVWYIKILSPKEVQQFGKDVVQSYG